MRTNKHQTWARTLGAILLNAFGLLPLIASAATVNAVWNSAADVPVTANGYSATGNTIDFTLNFPPATGTDLMVANNTGPGFISGTFDNLAQGQTVALSYGEATCQFVANYYGGSGNDLVLVWAGKRAFACGLNQNGQVGDSTSGVDRLLPVPVTATGVLAGKTVVALAASYYHSLALCSDGTLAAWGRNNHGQLGDNTTTERHVPVPLNTGSDSALYGKRVVAIAAGYVHSLAVCSDGTAAAWGSRGYGQLGSSSTATSEVPLPVDTTGLAAGQRFDHVASGCSANHTLALVAAPSVSPTALTAPQTLPNGAVQFTFTNTSGAFLSVLATTNPALPLSNWTALGDPTEVSPGHFQFADSQATTAPGRFYQVCSP